MSMYSIYNEIAELLETWEIRIYFIQEKDHSLRDSHKQIRRLEDEIKELVMKNDGKEVQMKVKFSVPVILEYMVSINIHPETVNKKLHVCVPNLYLDLPSIYCIYVCISTFCFPSIVYAIYMYKAHLEQILLYLLHCFNENYF